MVEDYTGITIELPETVSAEEANELAIVAQCIRDCGQEIRFESMEAICAPESQLLHEDPITGLTVNHHLDARVLGHVVSLGTTVCEMPPLRGCIESRPLKGPLAMCSLSSRPLAANQPYFGRCWSETGQLRTRTARRKQRHQERVE